MKKDNAKIKKGFTLVEMIVAIGLFTIVLFITSSAFLAVINADRKSRATRIAMDNLNIALEDMSRRIKTGTAYDCGGGSNSGLTATNDCDVAGNISQIAFTEQDGTTRTSYWLDGDGGVIKRSSDGGAGLPVTSSSEVTIISLKFIVGGSTKWAPGGGGDTAQPYVVIFIDGVTNAGKITSAFKMQTTVTQRAYDI